MKKSLRTSSSLLTFALTLGGVALPLAMTSTAFAQARASDEIVVTANRTESTLSKTPVAVTALSGEQMVSAGITNPLQIQDRTPGLSIDRANGLQITIRGVSSTDQTEKGDPSASFLLDGIYIARPQVQDVSFYDIERVEVLRGPQGTLYGRNTTAGVVNVLFKRPTLGAYSGSIDVNYGNYNALQTTGVFNAPLGDKAAIRAAINYDRRDTYIDRAASPFDPNPERDNLSGRVSALFEPSDNFNFLVRGDYAAMRGDQREGVPLENIYAYPLAPAAAGQRGTNPTYVGGDSDDVRVVPYSDISETDLDNSTWGVSGEANWNLSDALTLTYLGSYREFSRDEQIDALQGRYIFSPTPVYRQTPQTFKGDYWQNSQEIRLAYSSDRFKGQVGAYYFKEQSGIEFLIFGRYKGAPAPAFSVAYVPGEDGYVFGFPQDPTIAESTAFFGQGTFSVTDAFRLTGGARYTEDDKSRVGLTISHRALGEPNNFVADPVTNPVADSLNNASASFARTTWKVGAEADLNPSTLLYANVSTGYKAGGFNDGCLITDANCTVAASKSREALYYQPETLTAYEAGIKTRLLDDTLRLFANYFHYDYQNLQISQLRDIGGGALGNVTTNAGQAEVDGVEVETTILPTSVDAFNVAVTWTDARYTEFTTAVVGGVDLSGLPLNRAPEFTVNVGYNRTIPLAGGGNVVLGVNSKLSTEFFIYSGTLLAQFRQPGYTQTDVTATYNAPDDRWYLQAYGKNLEDTYVVNSVAPAGGFPNFQSGNATLSAPRTYGVRFGYKF